jgi:hypothetical protein
MSATRSASISSVSTLWTVRKRTPATPDRVKEQGDYFGGLSEKETLRVGKKATEFTEKWLKGGGFTMHTRYEDAQGASSKKRYYVWIEKDDKILAEDLVRNGLARLHGMNTDPPGALTERQFEMRLRTLEKETKDQARRAAGPSQTATGTRRRNPQSAGGRTSGQTGPPRDGAPAGTAQRLSCKC